MSWISRQWQRLREKMLREKAPPEFVARGWAIGMFYGWTIPFGFQLMLSIPTAILLRGSKIGATVGTFVTNHFTIFVIYPVQCWVGNRILELCGFTVLPVEDIIDRLKEIGGMSMLSAGFWKGLAALGGGIMYPFFVGGFLFAAIFTPLTYWGVLSCVRRYRARKAEASAREEAQDG
jgi:uncharacterized protein (DUF2062 family)